jgi:hypothetical protein
MGGEKTYGGTKGTVAGSLLASVEGDGGGGRQSGEAEGGERELHLGGCVGSDGSELGAWSRLLRQAGEQELPVVSRRHERASYTCFLGGG